MKKALKDEFCDKLNSAELHRQLEKRKMKKDESVQTYLLVMKEIASRGEIEEEALFQYVIDGVDELSMNKDVLYGARGIKEFKEKLKIYEKMRIKNVSTSRSANISTVKKRPKDEIRCYNCGETGHKSTSCENKSKGTKCFKCNEFGHKAL